MARTIRKYTFTTDTTTAVPVGSEVQAGRIAVYARRTAGSGTATLAVRGSFAASAAAVADTTNQAVQITAATAMGTGVLTVITADGNTPFSVLHLVYDVTGTATFEVFVTSY